MSTFTLAVRRIFALPEKSPEPVKDLFQIQPATLIPRGGERVLITGASGSGKSRLLSELKDQCSGSVCWIDPSQIRLLDLPVIDLVCRELSIDDQDEKIIQGLDLLSRVGLAEAWTYLKKPAEISDGQRWRLLLAIAIQRAKSAAENRVIVVLAMDEFAALLDRITAIVIARSVRKLIDLNPTIGVIVVTSHDDLSGALDPHTHVHCDFGVMRLIRRLPSAQDTQRRQENNQQQHAADYQKRFK